jgi:hypothetical protein
MEVSLKFNPSGHVILLSEWLEWKVRLWALLPTSLPNLLDVLIWMPLAKPQGNPNFFTIFMSDLYASVMPSTFLWLRLLMFLVIFLVANKSIAV